MFQIIAILLCQINITLAFGLSKISIWGKVWSIILMLFILLGWSKLIPH
jgi:type III secretory pathway component EscR